MPKSELAEFSTPFDALKSAEQYVQFAIDPSKGLTRERYRWWSDGTLFDSTNATNGAGEINLETASASGSTAVLSSAFTGQYISQALAKPGLKLFVDPSNLTENADGLPALKHGVVEVGPFWMDASQNVETGFGYGIDQTGQYMFWKNQGSHKGDSPVYQDKWKTDQLDDNGEADVFLTPEDGRVFNFPYTWYNAGRLGLSVLDNKSDTLAEAHAFDPPNDDPGRASLKTPNLPVSVRVDNDGTASQLSAAVGGMQYTLYGDRGLEQTRSSYMASSGVSVGTQVNSPIDPIAEPGDPIYAVQRDSSSEDLELQVQKIDIETDNDIYIYIWDVFDAASALTNENFVEPFTNFSGETRALVDRSATDFSNADAIFRKMKHIRSGGNKNEFSLSNVNVEQRIPRGATRVTSAVHEVSTATVNYIVESLEGF